MNSPVLGLRSPADRVGDLVYFGRMLDKIRLQLDGKLPPDYQANLGRGFDERCVHFLRISYRDFVDHVTAHRDASDDDLLTWAFNTGRRPDDEEIEIWNGFLSKRGWRDEGSETLTKRKADGGLGERADIATFFQFIDADEGRM